MAEASVTFADLTTMRVGGAPDRLLTASNRNELIDLARELISEGGEWMPLGGGSNTIVSDAGFPGSVLLVRSAGVQEVTDESLSSDRVRVRVEAGQDWDELVQITLDNGWIGLEALSGIPGFAGAAPIQNIGAYGVELKDTFHSLELLDLYTGELREVSASELDFGYRDSALKRRDLEGLVVSIDLQLKRADSEDSVAEIKYEQLARALKKDVTDFAAPRAVREAVLQLRHQKGMVLVKDDHDTWSSGSFFMNPVVSESFARSLPKEAPKYPIDEDNSGDLVFALSQSYMVDDLEHLRKPEGQVKLSAAWLIEATGIKKGFRLPGSGALISNKHTLAITNGGAATAEDVAELARFVVARVRSEYGVLLVPEPNLYGLQL